MQTSSGRVISVTGDRAVVQVDAELACARCASGKGCGAGLFGKGDRPQTVEAMLSLATRPAAGDRVELSMAPARILAAAMLVYGLPMGMAVGGAAAAWGLGFEDDIAAILAVLGLAAGYLLAKWRLRRNRCLRDYLPTVTALSPQSDRL